MTGLDYFKDAVLIDYANFSDRARRSEYWYFRLFSWLLLAGLIVAGGLLEGVLSFIPFGRSADTISFIPFSILYFGLIIPKLAVTVRRLHDTGNSGWLYVISIIPIVGSLIILILVSLNGERWSNQWGEDPKSIIYDDGVDDHLVDDDLV